MSVPSSKSIMMLDSAYLVVERSTVWRGRPCISISIGKLMRASTSSGDMPGAFTTIITCGLEISGKASIGKVRKAHRPPAIIAAASSKIIRRWINAKRMSAAIMVAPPCYPSVICQQPDATPPTPSRHRAVNRDSAPALQNRCCSHPPAPIHSVRRKCRLCA